MSSRARKPQTISREFVEEVKHALREGKPVRRRLPFGGRLHIERQLPFLCVYRDPVGKQDLETERLIAAEASYLIVSARADQKRRTAALVDQIVETLSSEFGAFLLIEIWAGAEVAEDETVDPEALRPSFTIHAEKDEDEGMAGVHESLRDGLKRIRITRKAAEVSVRYSRTTTPPGISPLVSGTRRRALNCRTVGLAVQPIYRSPDRGEDDFPLVLRSLHRGFSRALKRACFTFTLNETTHRPRHFHNLGQRAVSRAMWEVDRKLAEIGASFDFLLQVTPINISAGWHSFRARGFEKQPVFHYRPLPIDPAEVKKRLYSINLSRIEDPTLDLIFREKRNELDRQLTMLIDRNTRNFLYGSLQLYGPVDDSLMRSALEILDKFPGRTGDDAAHGHMSASEFADLAQAELRRLRQSLPEMSASVQVSDEIASMMVSRGNLMISENMRISGARARALIEHEIGTHVVTYWNARAQPLKLLASGLAGYDEFQEGLAVLSEHLLGGLSRDRLRILAGRVVAARYIAEGATFIETFRRLSRNHDFEQRSAYRIATRIYRGGGLTKDSVYLRGLISILDYFRNGGDMEPLLIGKIARRHIPIVRELRHRGVLRPPVLRPAYLDKAEAQERLLDLAAGATPIQLVNLRLRRHRRLAS